MSGIYIYMPTTRKSSENSEPQTKTAKKPASSASSAASKDETLLSAINLVEAHKLLEPLVKELLDVSPKYIFEKHTRGDFQTYYVCLMIIKAKKPLQEEAYEMFEGSYIGQGLSKRLAQMEACKNAMLKWDKKDGVIVGEMSFAQYTNTILRASRRK